MVKAPNPSRYESWAAIPVTPRVMSGQVETVEEIETTVLVVVEVLVKVVTDDDVVVLVVLVVRLVLTVCRRGRGVAVLVEAVSVVHAVRVRVCDFSRDGGKATRHALQMSPWREAWRRVSLLVSMGTLFDLAPIPCGGGYGTVVVPMTTMDVVVCVVSVVTEVLRVDCDVSVTSTVPVTVVVEGSRVVVVSHGRYIQWQTSWQNCLAFLMGSIPVAVAHLFSVLVASGQPAQYSIGRKSLLCAWTRSC